MNHYQHNLLKHYLAGDNDYYYPKYIEECKHYKYLESIGMVMLCTQ